MVEPKVNEASMAGSEDVVPVVTLVLEQGCWWRLPVATPSFSGRSGECENVYVYVNFQGNLTNCAVLPAPHRCTHTGPWTQIRYHVGPKASGT